MCYFKFITSASTSAPERDSTVPVGPGEALWVHPVSASLIRQPNVDTVKKRRVPVSTEFTWTRTLLLESHTRVRSGDIPETRWQSFPALFWCR